MFLLFLMWLEGFKLHLWACIVFLLEDGSRNTFLLLLWGHVPPGGRSLQENMKNYLAAFFNRSVKPQWWKWWPLFGICLGWREGQSMMKEKSWLLREDFLGYWKPFKFYICFLRSYPCNSDLNVGGKYSCPHNTFPFWRCSYYLQSKEAYWELTPKFGVREGGLMIELCVLQLTGKSWSVVSLFWGSWQFSPLTFSCILDSKDFCGQPGKHITIYNIVSKGNTFHAPNNEFIKCVWLPRRDELTQLYPEV